MMKSIEKGRGFAPEAEAIEIIGEKPEFLKIVYDTKKTTRKTTKWLDFLCDGKRLLCVQKEKVMKIKYNRHMVLIILHCGESIGLFRERVII
jgi:hypothetical protein